MMRPVKRVHRQTGIERYALAEIQAWDGRCSATLVFMCVVLKSSFIVFSFQIYSITNDVRSVAYTRANAVLSMHSELDTVYTQLGRTALLSPLTARLGRNPRWSEQLMVSRVRCFGLCLFDSLRVCFVSLFPLTSCRYDISR